MRKSPIRNFLNVKQGTLSIRVYPNGDAWKIEDYKISYEFLDNNIIRTLKGGLKVITDTISESECKLVLIQEELEINKLNYKAFSYEKIIVTYKNQKVKGKIRLGFVKSIISN